VREHDIVNALALVGGLASWHNFVKEARGVAAVLLGIFEAGSVLMCCTVSYLCFHLLLVDWSVLKVIHLVVFEVFISHDL
jgi:hypothetical protein